MKTWLISLSIASNDSTSILKAYVQLHAHRVFLTQIGNGLYFPLRDYHKCPRTRITIEHWHSHNVFRWEAHCKCWRCKFWSLFKDNDRRKDHIDTDLSLLRFRTIPVGVLDGFVTHCVSIDRQLNRCTFNPQSICESILLRSTLKVSTEPVRLSGLKHLQTTYSHRHMDGKTKQFQYESFY